MCDTSKYSVYLFTLEHIVVRAPFSNCSSYDRDRVWSGEPLLVLVDSVTANQSTMIWEIGILGSRGGLNRNLNFNSTPSRAICRAIGENKLQGIHARNEAGVKARYKVVMHWNGNWDND